MYNVNIALLSYRETALAREIVGQCCDLTMRMPGVSFSLGFGGDCKSLNVTYQQMFKSATERGGEARLLCSKDVQERLVFILNSSKEWTLFLSDDDIFSINYLRSLVESTSDAGPHVSIVNPTFYLVTNAGEAAEIAHRPSDDPDARTRYQKFNNLPLRGVSFYAAHRTDNINVWHAYFQEKGRHPSYMDQVLLTLDVLTGVSLSTREFTVGSYDISNWANTSLSIIADAKGYDKPQLVLFHELFWCIDAFKILTSAGLIEEIFKDHLLWWAAMIHTMIQFYPLRLKTLNLDDALFSDIFIMKIIELFEWFSKIKFTNQGEYLLNCYCDLETEILDFFTNYKSPILLI